jgi:hypothetical protein
MAAAHAFSDTAEHVSAALERSESAGGARMQRDHDKIQERAYEIWNREGRQDGRAEEYWAQAERELGAPEASSAPGVTADPAVSTQAKKKGDSASLSAKPTETGQRKRRGSQSARQA